MKKNEETNESCNYRYPGLLNFEDTETHRQLFFGRDQEKEALLNKVLADKLVVLFARSGLGKTSLINAGLKQSLRDMGFIPITIRFDETITNPVQKVYADIEEIVERQKSDLEYEEGEKDSLWKYFKTVSFWTKNNNLRKPVLILDQFEEFFENYLQKEREDFIEQLADLVNNNIPEDVEKNTSGEGGRSFYSEKPPQVKILISIREDYLGHLEEISGEIPGILHHRYRLLPMKREDARKAIIRPAQKKDKHFCTKPFTYDDLAVEQMLDFLGTQEVRGKEEITDEVECFQLQLLCQSIEVKVKERQKEAQGDIIVDENILKGEDDMRRVMENFYDNQINKLNSRKKRRKARSLCEKELINKKGRRQIFGDDYIESEFGVSKDLLEELVELRLLRTESRKRGSLYLYELSHDTLTAPIRRSFKRRQAKKRRTMIPIFAVCILIILAIIVSKASQKSYENYENNVKLSKALSKSNLELAVIYIKNNQVDEALEVYRQALDTDNRNANIYKEIVDILEEKGMNDRIEEIYDIASTSDSQESSFYLILGNEYYHIKTYGKAAEMFKKAIQRDPKNSSAYKWLGDALYQKAVEIDNKDTGAIKDWRNPSSPQVKYKDTIKTAMDNKTKSASAYYAEAIDAYKKAVEIDPDDAHAYRGLGDVLLKQGNHEDTVNAYNEAIEIDPDDARAYNGLGNAFSKQRNYEKAVLQYKKALDIDPGYADALQGYRETLKALERIKSERVHEELTKAFYNQGNELLKQREYEKAIEAFKKTIEMNPEDTLLASIGLGKALFSQGDYDKAVEIFNKAVKTNPDHAEPWYYLGMIRSQQGKYNEAINAYKQAVEKNPDYTDAYYKIGTVYSKQKEYGKAVKAYEEAPRFPPGNNALKKRVVFTYFLGQKFEKASSLADELQKEKFLSSMDRLEVVFISTASLLSNRKEAEASRQIKAFIEFVKSLPPGDYDVGNHAEIRKSIITNITLSSQEKHILQQMLEILRAPRAEVGEKIKEFETDFVIYKHTIALNKKRPDTYEKLAVLYVKNGKPDKAIDVYRQALTVNPGYAEIYKNIARMLRKKGRKKYIEQVKKIYMLASGSGSRKAALYFNLANDYYYLDMFQQAAENYKKSIEIEPGNARLYYRMGLVLSEQKEYSAAIEAFEKAKEINPDDKITILTRKKIIEKEKDYKMAERALEKAKQQSLDRAETHYKMGEALSKMEKYNEALEAYKKTIDIDSNHHKAYYKMGDILSLQEKYESAIEAYKKAIEIEGENVVEAYIGWGEALFALRNYNEAIAQYKKANTLIRLKREKNPVAYYKMAEAFLALEQYNDADDAYVRAFRSNPTRNAYAYNYRGNFFYYQEEYDKAIEAYKKSIKEDPLYASAYYNMGTSLNKQEKYRDAIKEFKKVIEIDPRYLYAYNGMGNAFTELGNYGEAIEAYKEALDINPGYVTTRANLAEVYLVSERIADALESAEEVMEEKKIAPHYQIAMRFVAAASLIFQQRRLEAVKRLEDLIIYYKLLSKDYDRIWSYEGIKEFLDQNKKISPQETEWLIQLIDILGSPKAGGDKEIKKLEATIKATFKERKKSRTGKK